MKAFFICGTARYLAMAMLLFLCASFKSHKAFLTRWVIDNGCSLKVEGSTNVNKFSCVISNYSRPDTIVVYRNKSSATLKGYIMLGIGSFDCHNPVMTADLRKTLRAKAHPWMIIRFLTLDLYPEPGNKDMQTRGMVLIELAGKSKKLTVDYHVVQSGRDGLNLVGTQKVLFSDFGISPPRKLGGMIKTNDELDVEFNLRLKVIN